MEAKETAEINSSNPYFEVLASGNFGKNKVNAKLVPPQLKPRELVEETTRVWEDKNRQRIESGKKPMTDNSQLALKSVKTENGQLEIEVYPAKYSDLIAMQDVSVKNRFAEYAPQILGTNVLTRTVDGKLVIAQRGLNVATKPGAMSAPGGYPDLARDISDKDDWIPFSTVKRELLEETGIMEGELKNISSAGIILNKTVGNPSMIFFAETSLTADEVQKRTTDKEINVKFIPDTKEEIQRMILWWAFSPSPSGASTLALYGKQKYGEDWFKWINERLKRRDFVYTSMNNEQLTKLNERASARLSKLNN